MTTKRRIIATAISASALLSVGAVSALATSSPAAKPVSACRTSHGVLALQSHGHCPKGSTKVTLGARGPRGATGRRGVADPKGATGPAGPKGDPGIAYTRTITVSPSGDNADANGATLIKAVGDLSPASADHPMLLDIEPGTYDVGTTGLSIPAHADVAGSGRDVTTIEGTVSGTLLTVADSEIRDLTVSETLPSTAGNGAVGAAIDLSPQTSASLTDVDATASASSNDSDADAIEALSGTVYLTDVNATAANTGGSTGSWGLNENQNYHQTTTVYIDGGSYYASGANDPLFDTGIEASGYYEPVTLEVRDAILGGQGGAVSDYYGGSTIGIAASQVTGSVANATCVDDWNANSAPLNAGCAAS